MKLHVVLQSFGLVGVALGVLLLFGIGWAVLAASAAAVVAGTSIELGRNTSNESVVAAIREYERTH